MNLKQHGIHHISITASHPQENIDFFYGVLGLKLIKKTVNYDDPSMYHLYYAADTNNLLPSITFFPILNAKQGVIGDGQVGITILSIPKGSIDFWDERLNKFQIEVVKISRFNQNYLSFRTTDGLEIELVETDLPKVNSSHPEITNNNAIQGLYGAVLYSQDITSTTHLIESIFNYKLINENNLYRRYQINNSLGGIIDIRKPKAGSANMGKGTVHHLAFLVEDVLEDWLKLLKQEGYEPTEVKQRNYFKSIYFREKGGILIELATLQPGFLIDEEKEELGKTLKLPPWYEENRLQIEDNLIPLKIEPASRIRRYGYTTKQEYLLQELHQEILKQINEYARLAKTRELTEEETIHRQKLRHEYVSLTTRGIRNMMDNVKFVEKDGVKDIKKKDKTQN